MNLAKMYLCLILLTCMFIFALGEFGIVYKAHFVKSLQLHVMPDIVAVKTLKGQQ